MTHLCYIPRNFQQETLNIIAQANQIIDEYDKLGLKLTLRSLYYQFVSRDALENTPRSYQRLSVIISDARLAGLISWHAIEDRVRNLEGRMFWDGPAEAIKQVRRKFLTDRWKTQDWRPEVWSEKSNSVISGACYELCCDYFATRGYNSQSEQWAAGQRFASYIERGQRPIVFHIADHDPAGIDMTRDNRERLTMFAGTPVTVVRIALNMAQIEQYNPPPNYAKPTDSKTEGYKAQFGSDECWELDALDPRILRTIIRDAVAKIRDDAKWGEAIRAEAEQKDIIDAMIEQLDPNYNKSQLEEMGDE